MVRDLRCKLALIEAAQINIGVVVERPAHAQRNRVLVVIPEDVRDRRCGEAGWVVQVYCEELGVGVCAGEQESAGVAALR